jgi:TonB family protein
MVLSSQRSQMPVTPAYANWFSSPSTVARNVGSAPNPRPQDIRAYRLPQTVYPPASLAINEQGTVKLKISLTEQGAMSSVVVESSSGFPRLDNAAVQYMTDMMANRVFKQANSERCRGSYQSS